MFIKNWSFLGSLNVQKITIPVGSAGLGRVSRVGQGGWLDILGIRLNSEAGAWLSLAKMDGHKTSDIYPTMLLSKTFD